MRSLGLLPASSCTDYSGKRTQPGLAPVGLIACSVLFLMGDCRVREENAKARRAHRIENPEVIPGGLGFFLSVPSRALNMLFKDLGRSKRPRQVEAVVPSKTK